MKPRYYVILFLSLLTFNSCKKDKDVRDIKFTSTKYETLGYDYTGKPNFLLKDNISPDLLQFVNSVMPDGNNLPVSNPALFSDTAIADIAIKEPSDVYITFVHSDGTLNNSIAFYTYPTNAPPTSTKDIKVITYVFPSAGVKTPLSPGDKVRIGSFNVGTSIGFVLLQDAWDTLTHIPNNETLHFCTNDILNPEEDPNLRKHAVLVKYAPQNITLIGFEDVLRTEPWCDNDFEDVVIYCTVEKN